VSRSMFTEPTSYSILVRLSNLTEGRIVVSERTLNRFSYGLGVLQRSMEMLAGGRIVVNPLTGHIHIDGESEHTEYTAELL